MPFKGLLNNLKVVMSISEKNANEMHYSDNYISNWSCVKQILYFNV